MKNLKKNQIIIFVIALMLVTAGYLSFTTNNKTDTITTSSNIENVEKIGSIGDAKLVNSNGIVENNNILEDGIISNEAVTSSKDLSNDNNSESSNTLVENEKAITTNSKEIDEYFSSSKLTRDTMYSQMIEAYEKILENQNISSEQKGISQTEIKNINDTKNKIMICENLIKTKGFQDSVIFVNGDSISVILRTDKLEQDQIAQVQNIITREMQADINNIHISSK